MFSFQNPCSNSSRQVGPIMWLTACLSEERKGKKVGLTIRNSTLLLAILLFEHKKVAEIRLVFSNFGLNLNLGWNKSKLHRDGRTVMEAMVIFNVFSHAMPRQPKSASSRPIFLKCKYSKVHHLPTKKCMESLHCPGFLAKDKEILLALSSILMGNMTNQRKELGKMLN